MNTEVSVEGSKYTFKIDEHTGKVTCDRFGEPWVTFTEGTTALIALIYLAIEGAQSRESK